MVAEKGRPVLQLAFGVADPASGRRNGPETRFNLASLGKMFTAVAVGQLVDKEKVRFDDAVGRHLTGLPPEIGAVTIDQLLTHRSGLGDYARMENRSAILGARSATDLLPVAIDGGLKFAPGEKQSYSNSGYVVLGAMIEALTGMTYADYVRDNVFRPAGMKSSSLDGLATRAVPLTSQRPGGGTSNAPRRPAPIIGGPRASPAGGAVASALDLIRFGEALRKNRLVSRSTLERLWMPHVQASAADGQISSYGYGFTRIDGGGDYAVGHGGGSLGANSHFELYPRSGRSVVILSNYDPPAATRLIEAARRAFLMGKGAAEICPRPEASSVAGRTGPVADARSSEPTIRDVSAEAEVRGLERRWLDAYENRDSAVMERLLADDFTITYPQGESMTKGDVLTQLKAMAGRPAMRFSTEGVEARVSADRVVLTGTLIMQGQRGESRLRYTDTWIRRGDSWQVVSSRLTHLGPS